MFWPPVVVIFAIPLAVQFFIARRILWAIALLFIVSGVIFLIFYILPSADPAVLRAGRNAGTQQIANIRHSLGLDRPIYVQYVLYMRQVFLHFDFGYSYEYNVPVRQLIFSRLPATAWLVIGGMIVWLAIGLTVGIISASRRRSLTDRLSMTVSLTFISAPTFWLGLVSLYLFADDIGRFKVFAGQGSFATASTVFQKAWAMVLPWLILAASSAAVYARYMRASMIDTLGEDYIRTARAKGLPERRVLLRHSLRSAITPIVTLVGLDLGTLLAGQAIITETVFNIPGLGRLLAQSIGVSDLATIQGVTLFGAFFIVFFNLVVDIGYAYLDPRVRY
ncbi:MAG TPA: ABC transporter permease [Solirubrobacteraceae bacterium]|nr:ABC transporter permease [Solirubrobacteraceae bacterium]